MRRAPACLALVGAAFLTACVGVPAETEVVPVGGRTFEPLPDGTPVRLIAAPRFPEAWRRAFGEVPVADRIDGAARIGVGTFWMDDAAFLRWPVDFRGTRHAVREAARSIGGDVVLLREAGMVDLRAHPPEPPPRGWRSGYFEVLRKNP